MGKLDVYKCDRCGKRFEVPEEKTPATIEMREYGVSDPDEYVLCEGCSSTFYWFIGKDKEFDELARKLCDEEFPEEED